MLYGVPSVASISVSTPCRWPEIGEPLEIDDAQMRIRRRFADQQSRARRDGRFHRVVVAGRHLPRRDAEPRQMLGAELAAAVITLVEEDHLVAGVELGHQQPDDGRHAGGEQQGRFAPFERRQLPLDDFFAGIAVAAIFLARLLLLDEVDHRLRVGKRVGRGAEDRIGDRVGELLPVFAAVDGNGRQPLARWSSACWSSAFRRCRGLVRRSNTYRHKKTAALADQSAWRGWLRVKFDRRPASLERPPARAMAL